MSNELTSAQPTNVDQPVNKTPPEVEGVLVFLTWLGLPITLVEGMRHHKTVQAVAEEYKAYYETLDTAADTTHQLFSVLAAPHQVLLTTAETGTIAKGDIVHAIKSVRSRNTNLTLQDAKEVVDFYDNQIRLRYEKSKKY